MIHNHPAGKPKPSDSDNEVMEKIKAQAEIMDMKFLDFIIIGDLGKEETKNYWSMFEEELGGEYGLG